MKFDVQKYFSVTTIHGFSYVSNGSHIVERVFWGIVLTCSAICSLYLIFLSVIKFIDIPIVVYLSEKAVPISEINFPAVTLCPDFLPSHLEGVVNFEYTLIRYERHSLKEIPFESFEYLNETEIDPEISESYTKILKGIENGEIDFRKLSLKTLKRLQVIDMITNRGIFSKLNYFIPNDDFLDIMNAYKKEFLDTNITLLIMWMEEQKQYISEILTSEGLCFTFNNAYAKDVLYLNDTSNDFHYQLFDFKNPKNPVPIQILPRKISSSFTGLQMKFNFLLMFVKEIYEKNPHALQLFVHDPYELPSMNSKLVNIDARQRTRIIFDAEMNTIDDSLIDYKPTQRNCYLDSERRLKFFRKYTQANCLQECLTDFMIKSCGCAEFFMIRDPTTRICSASEEKCTIFAKEEFMNSQSNCDCLEPCNYVKYNLEVNHMDLMKYVYYPDQKMLEFSMSFKKDSINHFISKQLYDVIDLLSYTGGLFGLIAGFSLLSCVELVYWFTYRAVVKNFYRSTRVFAFNAELENEGSFVYFEDLTKDFLENSSIHGIRYISKKNILDKIFWGIFIVGSAIIGTLMILKTNEKLPNNQVIAYDDSMSFKENIHFPAITIIPEVVIGRDYSDLYLLFKSSRKEELDKMLKNETFKNHALRVLSQHCTCLELCVPAKYIEDEKSRDLTADAKKLMENEAADEWFQEQFSVFDDFIQPVFAKIRTRFAMGYTFNIIDADKLLNFRSINKEFRYFRNMTTKKSGNVFQMAKNISVRRGNEAVLSMKFTKNKPDPTEEICKEIGLLIHDVDAMPTFFKRDDFINIASGELDVEVIPEIIKSDEDMKSINSSIRKCYFEGEKYLKFFNTYSERNCIIECLTNYTLNMCNCSDPSQPFEEQNFCKRDFMDDYLYCPSQAIFEFHTEEDEETSCGCIPTCDSVSYRVKYVYKSASDNDEVEINVRLNSEDAILFRRYQLFTFSDIVSYVGGLLGLLAGISMLSIVEFFYYFIIRVLVDAHRV